MNCESKGVGHSYGSRHTELVITLTDSDGEPVNSNQEELNSDYGGQAGDLWLHKNGEWVAGILASQDAVMQKKTVSKVKFIDGRKVKMTGQNNQKKLFRIQENRVQRDDARGALLPLATTMFTHRIRTGRPVLYLDPLHSLSAEPEFQDYCIDMDKQLYSMLEADLQRVKDFEYFRSEHNVLTVDKIIPHLRANQHEVHQVDKEERAIDFMACDIASAASYPHRRAQSRGVQQAVLTQANEDQVSKNVMGAKLGAVILGRSASLRSCLLTTECPGLSKEAEGKTQKNELAKSQKKLEAALLGQRVRRPNLTRHLNLLALLAVSRTALQMPRNRLQLGKPCQEHKLWGLTKWHQTWAFQLPVTRTLTCLLVMLVTAPLLLLVVI